MGHGVARDTPRGVARADRLVQEGVACSLATNNVLNPFTPFGDGSLLRMANLYANIAQLGRPEDLSRCLDMITGSAAKVMNLKDYGVAEGDPAGLVCRAQRAARPWPRSRARCWPQAWEAFFHQCSGCAARPLKPANCSHPVPSLSRDGWWAPAPRFDGAQR